MKKIIVFSLLIINFSLLIPCSAQYTVLHNFNHIGGAYPTGDVTLVGGLLYGMADSGGVNNDGCIFSIDTNGDNYKVLFNFDSVNGAWPSGSLLYNAGMLYGMTSAGGAKNDGCIFSIDTSGNGYKDLFNFSGGIKGAYPLGSLIFSGKVLYGMTYLGGAYNNYGCVFSIDMDGSNYTDILDFNGINGNWPYGSLILSGKVLYGMTGENGHFGNIFSIDTDGNEYKDLYDFPNISNIGGSWWPHGSLTLSGNKLYGMTSQGDNSIGNIFSVDTDGNDYTDMFEFNGGNGASPYGSLTLSGNTLYGMTLVGDIFSIDTNGNGFRDLYDFSQSTGAGPWGDVTLSGNMLYGMTNVGGADNGGVIFKFNYVTAGVNELRTNSEELRVYPNPSNGLFSLVIASEAKQSPNTIEVYTVLGARVYNAMLNQSQYISGQHDYEVNLSTQPSGVYLYRIIAENGSLIGEGKLVIQK